ncbi:hypothetical protein TBS_06330 [Thermobispora bispora]
MGEAQDSAQQNPVVRGRVESAPSERAGPVCPAHSGAARASPRAHPKGRGGSVGQPTDEWHQEYLSLTDPDFPPYPTPPDVKHVDTAVRDLFGRAQGPYGTRPVAAQWV